MRNRTAIVGIGTTAYGRNLGRSEQDLALEAVHAALADAGLLPQAVDAIFKVNDDPNDPVEMARNLGVTNLRFWGEVGYGGGAACGAVAQAAIAVAAGIARVAVAFKARNRGSGGRPWARTEARVRGRGAFEVPYGLVRPVEQTAIIARRYMYEYGATSAQFARVAVALRANATRNPRALYRDPITVEEVLASRLIADPLHLLDCCVETDGACAVVVTSAERARDLRQPVVLIRGVAMGSGPRHYPMVPFYKSNLFDLPSCYAAREVYTMAGLGPEDVDVALLYDVFSPLVLLQLEAYGFCKQGEAGPFVESGGIDWPNGTLPVNTHGGSLSEAYVHGWNHILEGVRQLRGTSTSQVEEADVVLVAAAPLVPTSALVLQRA